MPQYKIYIVDASDHITKFHDYLGSDDESASHKANTLRDGNAAEVWQSARLVSRIPKGGESGATAP